MAPPRATPEPLAGHWDHQQRLLLRVPGGEVNVAGGNLMVRSAGLSLDSALGGEAVQPLYNSATNQWLFGAFDMFYDGKVFRDETGAGLNAGVVANGGVIPGTVWIKVDDDTLRLKGGLVFEFSNGRPLEVHRQGQACPRIQYLGDRAADREITIHQQDCAGRGQFSNFNTELFTLSFDAEDRLVHVVDVAGRTADYTWVGDRLVRAQAGEQDFTYAYGLVGGRLTSIANLEGEEIRYEYFTPLGGALPRLQFVTRAGEGAPALRLDYYAGLAAGSGETVVTDSLGDTLRYHFDADRRVSRIDFEAVSESELFTYDGTDKQHVSHTLSNRTTTSYTRDAHENVLTVTHPTGNVVTHTYADANGLFRNHQALAGKVDSVGPIATWAYTEDQPVDYKRLSSLTNGAGETTRYDYHPGPGFTRVASVTSPNGLTLEIPEYGPLGRATKFGSGELFEEISFDAAGNHVAGSDGTSPEIGGVLSRSFDDDHRPVSAAVAGTDGVEEEVNVVRRSDGQILSIDRPPLGLGVGPDELHTYDGLGRRVQEAKLRDGAWKVMVTYTHNARERTGAHYADGTRREWVRDQLGRVVSYRVYDDQDQLENQAVFTYQDGRLVEVDDSERGRTIHSYDPVSGLLQLSQYFDPEGSLTSMTRYEFDLRARLTKKEYLYADAAPLSTLEFEYDLADRRIDTLVNGVSVLAKTYANGMLECITTGNGLERCFSYDEQLGIRNGAVTLDDASEVVETTTLDVAVLEDPVLWELHALTVAGGFTAESYFTVGPGTDPDVPGSEVGKRVLSWENGMDASDTYAYDSLSNQVDDADGDTYDYNLEGDLLLSATVGGQSVTYTYDAMDRADSRNGLPIERRADGRKVFYDGYETRRDAEERPLRFSDFNVDPPRVRDWSHWGGEIECDGSGRPVSLELGEVTVGFAGENVYKHLDFRGNVGFVSNASGEIVSLYEYSAYRVHAVMGDPSHPSRFVNQPSHGDLLELEARTCDMLVGRCLEPDPVHNLLNQYTYTLGNPIWFWDPDGRKSDVVTAIDVGLGASGFTIGIVLMVTTVAGITVPVLTVLAAVGFAITIYGFGRSVGIGDGWGQDIDPDPTGAARGAPDPNPHWNPADRATGAGPAGALPFGMLGVGAVGGVPACGLTGIEFLAFVAWILGRRRRRA